MRAVAFVCTFVAVPSCACVCACVLACMSVAVPACMRACVRVCACVRVHNLPVSPRPAQGPGVADQLVQHVEDLAEGGSLRPVPLPAVQHELVQNHGAVHGRRQAVALLYRLDHLRGYAEDKLQWARE